MRSIASVLILTALLTACETVPAPVNCPHLNAPPKKAVDALEEAGRADPSVASWVIELERHYRKLDDCE